MLAPGALDVHTLASALGGTFLCSASANTCNQLIEIRPDALMKRTANRPLPSGRMSPTHAAAFATMTGSLGVTTLALNTNLTTAMLGAGTIGLYALVYTPLKRITPLNTWVGAVVGALPPLMGWTAAGGGIISAEAAALCTSLFLWQIPHFMALAWMYRADYAAGGYKMVPLTDPSGVATSRICLEYSVYLTALPFVCWGTGLTSCMFPIESVGFNGLMLFAAWRFSQNSQRGQAHARRLFLASLAYLPAFFFCFLLHHKQRASATDTVEEPSHAPEVLDRLRDRGRQLCLHEHLVHPAGDMDAAATPAASASLCPVVAADALAQSAQAAIAPQQRQRH